MTLARDTEANSVVDVLTIDRRPYVSNLQRYWVRPRIEAGVIKPLSERSRSVLSVGDLPPNERPSAGPKNIPTGVHIVMSLEDRGPLTASELSAHMNVPRNRIERALRRLRVSGVVAKIGRLSYETIWGLADD